MSKLERQLRTRVFNIEWRVSPRTTSFRKGTSEVAVIAGYLTPGKHGNNKNKGFRLAQRGGEIALAGLTTQLRGVERFINAAFLPPAFKQPHLLQSQAER